MLTDASPLVSRPGLYRTLCFRVAARVSELVLVLPCDRQSRETRSVAVRPRANRSLLPLCIVASDRVSLPFLASAS